MNKRLKELCEQSKSYAIEMTKGFTGDEPVMGMDFFVEKFAELIVRECAEVADKAEPYAGYYDAYYLKKASVLIIKHFRVYE